MTDPKIPQPSWPYEVVDALPHPKGNQGRTFVLRDKLGTLMASDGVRWHDVTQGAPASAPAPMTPEAARIILELVQQVIATLLYFARAAHDKNPTAPAQTPFAQLPQAWQADFTNVAQMAVNGLEAEKRQAAERAALIHAERWLRAHLAGGVDDTKEAVNLAALELTSPTAPNIVTEVLAAYQEALCRK